MSFDIVLKHVGGERKTVSVEYVAPTLTYVSIRWGQSGIYDLNLKVNKLTARSQKAQRKGKPHWEAENIEAVRRAAREYLAQKNGNPKAEAEASYHKHQASMPNPNPRIGDTPNVRIRPQKLVTVAEAMAVEGYEPFPSYTGDPETD